MTSAFDDLFGDSSECDAATTTSGASEASAPTSSHQQANVRLRNSLPIFRKFLTVTAHGLDASRIVTRLCYEEWLLNRVQVITMAEPEKTFQRTLTAQYVIHRTVTAG